MVRKKLKKGSKAAKAWGRRMKALRTGVKRVKRKRSLSRVKSPIRKRRMKTMARKRVSRRRSSPRLGGNLMKGIYKPTGIIGMAILGLGAAAASAYVPVNLPYKEEAAAFIVGGIPAAGAVLALKAFSGNAPTSSFGGLLNY